MNNQRYIVNPKPVREIDGDWWEIVDTHTGKAGTRANNRKAAERVARQYNERENTKQNNTNA